MNQLAIDFNFDVCSARHRHNPQSVAAFGDKVKLRTAVYEAVKASGELGLTCDELSAKWGVGQNALSPRLTELRMQGLIERVSTRPTRSGKSAGVYVVKGEIA